MFKIILYETYPVTSHIIKKRKDLNNRVRNIEKIRVIQKNNIDAEIISWGTNIYLLNKCLAANSNFSLFIRELINFRKSILENVLHNLLYK